MKKIGSILFLLILVFNFCGYRWVLSYMERQATVRLENKLDAGNYDASQLVEVKIPLNLPYYSDWSDYENFAGEVQYRGENYQYVKRKIAGDTLYLLCIPHIEKNDIQIAKSDYFKSINNLQHDSGPQKNGPSPAIKLMLSEFLPNELQFNDLKSGDISLSPTLFETPYFSQFNPLTPAQPPEC